MVRLPWVHIAQVPDLHTAEVHPQCQEVHIPEDHHPQDTLPAVHLQDHPHQGLLLVEAAADADSLNQNIIK